MTFQSFFKLVELPTKAASLLPFLLGTMYAVRLRGRIDGLAFGLAFASLLSIDMATTLLNNWMDFRRARVREGYNYRRHNAIVRDNLPEREVALAFAALVGLGVLTGVALALRTDLWVLALGSLGFAVGMCYSWGPLPLSRTPLGELVSGPTMGGLIPLVAAMVQMPPGHFLYARADQDWIALHILWSDLLPLFLSAWPLILAISGVMLANNIADLETDCQDGRQTLPVLLGVRPAAVLYVILSLAIFGGPLLGVALGRLRPTASAILVCLPLTLFWAWSFLREPNKERTFPFSVYNLLAIGIVQTVAMGLGLIV